MTASTELLRLAAALLAGALVGVERQARLEVGEHYDGEGAEGAAEPHVPDQEQLAGIRTFSVLGILGCLAGLLGGWAVGAGALVVGGLLGAGYALSTWRGGDRGLTTVLSGVTVFMIGALCGDGRSLVGVAAAIGLASLLTLKSSLHRLARQMRRRDLLAVIKFAALSVVVLPLLPEEPVAVEGVIEAGAGTWWGALSLDLRTVWWLVILISSVSFLGYLLSKLLDTGRGLLWTSFLGGIASSTAVSLSYARRSRELPELHRTLLAGILLANAMMPLRVLAVLVVISPRLVLWAWFPLTLIALGTGLVMWLVWRGEGRGETDDVELQNPFALGPALKLGALFAFVLLTAKAAQAQLGAAALYAVAFVGGLADVDAVALSAASLVGEQTSLLTGVTMVALAVAGNTVLKGVLVVLVGARELRARACAAFAGVLVISLGALAAAHWAWVWLG